MAGLPVSPRFLFLTPREETGVHGREKRWHMIFQSGIKRDSLKDPERGSGALANHKICGHCVRACVQKCVTPVTAALSVSVARWGFSLSLTVTIKAHLKECNEGNKLKLQNTNAIVLQQFIFLMQNIIAFFPLLETFVFFLYMRFTALNAMSLNCRIQCNCSLQCKI